MRDHILRELHEWGLLDVAERVRHPIRDGIRRPLLRRWASRHHQPTGALARRLDATLWEETERFAAALERRHSERHEELRRTVRLGGGGDHRLLYFLTRLVRPRVVVETGVAAGWSTAAILAALHRNGSGHLWSSELVYDRPWMQADYSSMVGMVVDPDHRDRWTLHVDGDAENLPRILAACGPVDLVHIDSDKSVEGRDRVLDLVGPSLRPAAPIILDDISDNAHFRRLVRRLGSPFTVVGPRREVGIVWVGLERSEGD